MAARVVRTTVNDGVGSNLLAEAVRSLMQREACKLVATAAHPAITDNSTGTAGDRTAFAFPNAPFNGAAGTLNAGKTTFDTALGTVHNGCAVLMDSIDDLSAAAILNLPGTRGEGNGTIATPDTVPATTKTVTAVGAAGAVTYLGYRPIMVTVARNIGVLVEAVNRLARATGVAPLTTVGNFQAPDLTTLSITNFVAVAASVDGTDSISKAVADAFLLNCANWIAAIAAKYNTVRALTASGAMTFVAG